MTDKLYKDKKIIEKRADFVYSGKTQTNIMFEKPVKDNPYISEASYLHGYDLVELINKKSFVETLLLLFTGELPKKSETELLNRLMIALINLGPRHPAIKSAMVAGVSKTNAEHLLPIGLSVLGGSSNGANEVADSINFLLTNIDNDPKEVAANLISNNEHQKEGEFHICPGFGNQYGAIDVLSESLSNQVFSPLLNCDVTSKYIEWVHLFNQSLKPYHLGVLKTGLAATVFCQLGIAARESIGLFQILCAPGIFAQGVEQTHKPITAMPMLSDEQHIYKPE